MFATLLVLIFVVFPIVFGAVMLGDDLHLGGK